MEKNYPFRGQSLSLYRLFALFFFCGLFCFASLPTALAQDIPNNEHEKQSLSLLNAEPTLKTRAVGLQSMKLHTDTRPFFSPLNSLPALFLPDFRDLAEEQPIAMANPYLVDKNDEEQTLLLRLPKVDVGRIMIAIYSTSGNLLMKKSVRNQEAGSMVMDLKDLQAGAYLMEIQAAEIYEKFSFMLE